MNLGGSGRKSREIQEEFMTLSEMKRKKKKAIELGSDSRHVGVYRH